VKGNVGICNESFVSTAASRPDECRFKYWPIGRLDKAEPKRGGMDEVYTST
jgi:hypothetical protein